MLLPVLSLATAAAHAENGFFFLGAGASHNDVSNINITKLSNSTFQGPCGLCIGSTHSDGSAYAAYLIGFLPIPLPIPLPILDVYGKAGAAHWRLNGGVNIPGSSDARRVRAERRRSSRGIGVRAHISMFGARLEYENFDVPNTSGAKIAPLSVFLNL